MRNINIISPPNWSLYHSICQYWVYTWWCRMTPEWLVTGMVYCWAGIPSMSCSQRQSDLSMILFLHMHIKHHVQSMVPTTNAPTVNPAGLTPTPMTVDEGIFYQRVQACFSLCKTTWCFWMKATLTTSDKKLRKDTPNSWSKWYSSCVVTLNRKEFKWNRHAWANSCSSARRQTSDMSVTQQSFLVWFYTWPGSTRRGMRSLGPALKRSARR